MVYDIIFGTDKAASISTHGWFTLWSVVPDPQPGSPDAVRCVEMVGAGVTNEIGLRYNPEGDCLEIDPHNIPHDELQNRLATFWQSLSVDQHKQRRDRFLKARGKETT